MFEHGFPSHWTFLDKLIWLRASAASGGVNWVTVSGVSPLVLVNAVVKPIQSLIQYGKCTTSGGDIYCNNGRLVAVDDELPVGYKRITSIAFDGDFWYETGDYLTGDDDVTMTLDDTVSSGQNVFGSYNGTASGSSNFSLYIYGGSSTNNCYFRYGSQLVRPKLGSGERTITFGKSGTSGFATDVSVTPDTFETPANTYIGMLPNSSSPAYTGSIIGNILVGTRLKYIPCERQSDGAIGYYEAVRGTFIEPSGSGTPVKGSYDTSHENTLAVVGTPEVITLSASGETDQTATAVNLFATDNVADEQDIITGVVTRRTEVVVSNGTITIQALAEPVIEQVTPQPVNTAAGDNTLSWTAEVSGKTMEATYAKSKFTTFTGEIVRFFATESKPVKSIKIDVTPSQEGSGDPYPDGGSKNKLSPYTFKKSDTNIACQNMVDGVRIYQIVYGSFPTSYAYAPAMIPYELCKRNYMTLSSDVHWDYGNSAFIEVVFCNKDETVQEVYSTAYSPNTGNTWSLNHTFYVNEGLENVDHISIRLHLPAENTNRYSYIWYDNLQLEIGEYSTSYKPARNIRVINTYGCIDVFYQEQFDSQSFLPWYYEDVPYDFGREVGGYAGGYVEITNGKIVATVALKAFSQLTWTEESKFFFRGSGVVGRAYVGNDISKCLCDSYAVGVGENYSDFHMYFDTESSDIFVYDSRCDGVDEFIDQFRYHIPVFTFPLETPVVGHMTSGRRNMLIGLNSVWTYDGTLSVTVPSDVVIESAIVDSSLVDSAILAS